MWEEISPHLSYSLLSASIMASATLCPWDAPTARRGGRRGAARARPLCNPSWSRIPPVLGRHLGAVADAVRRARCVKPAQSTKMPLAACTPLVAGHAAMRMHHQGLSWRGVHRTPQAEIIPSPPSHATRRTFHRPSRRRSGTAPPRADRCPAWFPWAAHACSPRTWPPYPA